MKIIRLLLLILSLSVLLLFAKSVWAADQTVLGTGNTTAIGLSLKSPLVQSAQKLLVQQTKQIQSASLKNTTLDAISNTKTCVKHRAGLNDSQKQAIVKTLLQQGLLDPADDSTFPGGLKAGVFPPLPNDGSACPQLPQRFFAAPGGSFNSHHSYPGGLAIHEAFNNLSDLSFAKNYRRVYGFSGRNGLPAIDSSNTVQNKSDIYISEDIIIAAPIWHDWAKPIVFQWNADGTEFQELSIGGNGKTDNYGAAGDSKTGGHHIIGLAESIKRGLAPDFVITQASAHSNPTSGNEYKVVNWLRAAAILAQVDPVAKGYLFIDNQNRLRLPPLRQLGNLNLTAANQVNLLAEYCLHHLSDADFTLTVPAITIDQVILSAIAPQFGYNSSDTTTYNNRFRNPVLSYLSAERLLIIYGNSGLNGVKSEVNKLRKQGII